MTVRRPLLLVLAGVAVLVLAGVPLGVRLAGVRAAQPSPSPTPSLAPVAVPIPDDFSIRPVACTGPGTSSDVVLQLRDDYGGPLPVVETLFADDSQLKSGDLHKGENQLLGPASAAKLQVVIGVQGGEGAITSLSLQFSDWADLCHAQPDRAKGKG